jgi:replicative DNA helicase
MAKTLDVPVIALSQLSREVEKRTNKRPVNSDLRESGQIEQDADIIQFLYRDEIYNSEDNNPNKGFCEVITSKFRNGEIGTDYLETRLDCCRMLSTSNFPQAQAQENSGGYIPYKR